jgi:transcriptional regulator with XRE-family HTH domain
MAWANLTQSGFAARIHVHQTFVGRLLSGSRAPGLDAALAIERVTAEPRDDGETWPSGPIRVAEWVRDDEHAPTVAAPRATTECA